MKKVTDDEFMKLPLGSVVKIIWHNSDYHEKGETRYGTVFGDKIGYSDGTTELRRDIAECLYNRWCMMFLI